MIALTGEWEELLQVVPWEQGKLQTAFNIRLDELVVLSMVFMTGFARPTVGILSEDSQIRKFKVYEISVKEKVCHFGVSLWLFRIKPATLCACCSPCPSLDLALYRSFIAVLRVLLC